MTGVDVVFYVIAFVLVAAAIIALSDRARERKATETDAAIAAHRRGLAIHERRLDAFSQTLVAMQREQAEDVARLDDRCDVLVHQFLKLRLATMTTEELDRATDLLARDIQKVTEPGPVRPGSDDPHTPPAYPAQDEGRRNP